MSQMLLIPDPRPLDERLGRNFFKNAPERPGVYLMRDSADKVLYVGKANNLRQRLQSYRIANPDTMPRRHLRMLRDVARIEFQFCSGESTALKHESKLLRSLKPKFNRAGVWPGKTRFLVWRWMEGALELALTDVPETGWQRYGPMGGYAGQLRQTLACVIWMVVNPSRMVVELPTGWTHGRASEKVAIPCGSLAEEIATVLTTLFWGAPDDFAAWVDAQLNQRTHPFERAVIEGHLEILKEFSDRKKKTEKNRSQMTLL